MSKTKDTTDKEHVIEWFERAMLQTGRVYINMYYAPNGDAWQALLKEGVLKEAKLGKVYVGTSYKGHLFIIEYGPSDCEERLVCSGKI